MDNKQTYEDDAADVPDELRPPSKSQLKRDAEALQHLGGELIGLSNQRLDRLDLPDKLRTALRDAQRITQNGAKRRQLQYIGKLMRDVDVTPIKALLDEVKGISATAKAHQQGLERLRAQLLENEGVVTDIVYRYPHADAQQLRQLRRNALKEQAHGKPPRAYRELFRVLRELQGMPAESAEAVEDGENDDDGDD